MYCILETKGKKRIACHDFDVEQMFTFIIVAI